MDVCRVDTAIWALYVSHCNVRAPGGKGAGVLLAINSAIRVVQMV